MKSIRYYKQSICGVLAIGSWMGICLVGGFVPELIGWGVTDTIYHFDHSQIDTKSEMLAAFRSIDKIAEVIRIVIWCLSALMFVGCAGWYVSRPKSELPSQSSLPAGNRSTNSTPANLP